MKKLLLLAIIGMICTATQAQVFQKGTKMLSFGIGLGDRYIGSGYSIVVPPLQANFDLGITNKIGIGYIGIGGIIGYSINRYDYNYAFYNYNYRYTYSNLTIASRGTYHFDLDIDKLDLYAGIIIGVNISSVSEKYTGNGKPVPGYVYNPDGHGGLVAGPFAGARYMFSENFGAYSELGYAVSILTVGVSFKF